MTDKTYKPIFLDAGWIYEKYLGWFCIHEEPGIRVIRKKFGVLYKTLFMCLDVSDERLSSLMCDDTFSSALGIDIFHDFSRAADEHGLTFGGRQFDYVPNDRLLNIGTFVIDLNVSEDDLWKNLSQNSRTKTRKARHAGVRARISNHFCREDIDAFFAFYAPLAARFDLDTPSHALIKKMIVRGDLVTASALAPDGSVTAVNLIYLCPPYAFDLYGASGKNLVTGTGQFLRWECIRWVRDHDLKWYDLGGVASTDPSNPIYAFKKTFGGRYVDLGSEYRRVPPMVVMLYGCFRETRKFIRHVRSNHLRAPN